MKKKTLVAQFSVMLFLVILTMFALMKIGASPETARTLVLCGLLGSVVSLGVFFAAPREHAAYHGAMVVLDWKLGWICLPYWVYDIAHREMLSSIYDPKRLYPMLWIGELWRCGFLVYYGMYALVLLLVIRSLFRKEISFHIAILVASPLVIASGLSYFVPGLLEWVMD